MSFLRRQESRSGMNFGRNLEEKKAIDPCLRRDDG